MTFDDYDELSRAAMKEQGRGSRLVGRTNLAVRTSDNSAYFLSASSNLKYM